MTQRRPPPQISRTFNPLVTASPITAPSVPDAVRRDSPKKSFEMPGPDGDQIRRQAHEEQAEKDRVAAATLPPDVRIDNRGRNSVLPEDAAAASRKSQAREQFRRNNGRLASSFATAQHGRGRGR